MDSEKYLKLTGGLIMNLQGAETVLRYFLVVREGQSVDFPKPGDRYADETFATNWQFLGPLIDTYNTGLSVEERRLYEVDREIVRIRDAFAHGRVLTREGFPVTLWKFGKAKDGKVPIEFCETLTEDWLTRANELLTLQYSRIVTCAQARGYDGFG
jgi:hypothetical protein